MTRRPDADETIVLGERSGWRMEDRYYLRDLAIVLHQSPTSIRRWGKKQGLLKRLPLKCAGYDAVDYFTRYGALRVIAHFRAWQGEEYLAGRDYHRAKDMNGRYRSKRQCR
jgi:hypothetical protein